MKPCRSTWCDPVRDCVRRLLCVACLAAFAGTVLAHQGSARSPQQLALASAWTLDPLVLVPLALAAWLYCRGSLRAGAREACFAAGMAGLFVALVWPLDALGERLFSAHMAQHMVLMNVAAPLVVLGAPVAAMLRALPPRARRTLALLGTARRWRVARRWFSGLAVATLLQQAALWIWHAPSGIAAALQNNAIHIAMHASLFVAALVFWTAVLRPAKGGYWRSIFALAVTLKLSGLACIALLVRDASLYGAYGQYAMAWGLSPAQDEQLGWILMMALGTATYLAAALALAARSLARLERATSAPWTGAVPPSLRNGGSR